MFCFRDVHHFCHFKAFYFRNVSHPISILENSHSTRHSRRQPWKPPHVFLIDFLCTSDVLRPLQFITTWLWLKEFSTEMFLTVVYAQTCMHACLCGGTAHWCVSGWMRGLCRALWAAWSGRNAPHKFGQFLMFFPTVLKVAHVKTIIYCGRWQVALGATGGSAANLHQRPINHWLTRWVLSEENRRST